MKNDEDGSVQFVPGAHVDGGGDGEGDVFVQGQLVGGGIDREDPVFVPGQIMADEEGGAAQFVPGQVRIEILRTLKKKLER